MSSEGLKRFAQAFRLTSREREIVAMLSNGRSGTSIASRLGISYNTVKTHMKGIYAKCGVTSREQLLDKLLGAAA